MRSRDSRSSCRAASSACSASARWLAPPPWPPWPGQRLLPLPLGFLLLAPRELAQLLHQRVDLLIGLLLLRALRGLVLVRQLVEILLEELREIFLTPIRRRRRHRRRRRAAG